MDKYDVLKLDYQVCFPLYAAAREVIKNYTPLLNKLNLTYPQYVIMLAMWEHRELTQKKLCKLLYLDSGTLTPVLKGLESKGFVKRMRSKEDERVLNIVLTEQGLELRNRAVDIPPKIAACIPLDMADATELHRLLHKVLDCTVK